MERYIYLRYTLEYMSVGWSEQFALQITLQSIDYKELELYTMLIDVNMLVVNLFLLIQRIKLPSAKTSGVGATVLSVGHGLTVARVAGTIEAQITARSALFLYLITGIRRGIN